METEKERALAWWKEARFGLFIHFGVYSALEGIWNGTETPGIGEWIQGRLHIPHEEYKKYAKELTLEEFDAEQYVQLAKDAGMKYIVFTSKHHDGFAMYDSRYSDYNIVKMGPSKRDPVRELSEAAKKAGIKMCLYYSHALDWEDPDATGNDWDFDPEKKDFRRYLDGKCKHQLAEILTQYGDLGLIWFDVPRGITREQSIEVRNFVKSYQPNCLVSGRISYDTDIGDYGSLGDNEIPARGLGGYYETPATLNHTWGFKKNDHNWKTPDELIRLMAQLLSKGVNYLLNIGPMASGKIPEESVRILREVGKWVHLNEEAVYGTDAAPFSVDFDWGYVSRKGGHTLYLYLNHKMEQLAFSGLRSQVKRAVLLGEELKEIEVGQEHDAALDEHILKLTLPKSNNPHMDVVRIELKEELNVKEGLYQQADGTILLPGYAAKLSGESKVRKIQAAETADRDAERVEFTEEKLQLDPNGMIANWYDGNGKAEWNFTIYHPGSYQVSIATRSAKYQDWVGGHTLRAVCEGQTIEKVILADRPLPYADKFFFDEQISDLGTVTLKPGEARLTLTMPKYHDEDPAGLCVHKMFLTYMG